MVLRADNDITSQRDLGFGDIYKGTRSQGGKFRVASYMLVLKPGRDDNYFILEHIKTATEYKNKNTARGPDVASRRGSTL